MPSRRRFLAGGGLALAGIAGGSAALGRSSDSPSSATNAVVEANAGPGPDPDPDATATVTVDTIDWPMVRYDPAGTSHNPDASGPRDDVRVRWEREIDPGSYDWHSPILVGDTLFATGRDSIVALDRETGAVRFTRSGTFRSAPARASASAYRTDTLVVSHPGGIRGLNAAGGYDLFGLEFGLERWHGAGNGTGTPARSSPTTRPPVTDGETVYAIAPTAHRAVALDASSGDLRWEFSIGDLPLGTPYRPVLWDDTVYVVGYPTTVAAIDAETGERRWAVGLEQIDLLAPTAAAEGILVPGNRQVSLLDHDDGDVLWEYTHGGNADDGTVAVADGTAFCTDGTGTLHAIDLADGTERWTADTEYSFQTSPAVADGVVYLADFWWDELLAFDAETGDRRFVYDDGAGFSQPIFGDGVCYVVESQRILALEEAA
ncbi:PQQ-binding-like beta-propeller repeat protein [Natrarchaeobaculum aegyptiacum]|uniref:Pyrrolo-quinoline quinone repeat domain-containing protein n=1 Tax=Natrarchaeobaculum aegyptiacum TaxID=745377 RepID=A0A2Z2HYD0_9EURY|nr:PQQ-binding-like beta-propeller repeat protein [Natrarchaeobaculum aegyptiacum]ARS90074.1 hypothetical protein B1756_10270 [Natrarchaeobaculum aegyptiacum]